MSVTFGLFLIAGGLFLSLRPVPDFESHEGFVYCPLQKKWVPGESGSKVAPQRQIDEFCAPESAKEAFSLALLLRPQAMSATGDLEGLFFGFVALGAEAFELKLPSQQEFALADRGHDNAIGIADRFRSQFGCLRTAAFQIQNSVARSQVSTIKASDVELWSAYSREILINLHVPRPPPFLS